MKSPTAPGRWPVLGHAPALITRRLQFLSSLSSLSSVGEVVRIRLGPIPAYVVTSPAAVQKLLVPGDRDYDRGRLMAKASVWFGDSLLTSHGPSHEQQRRSLRSAFTSEQVDSHVRHVQDSARTLVKSWTPGEMLAMDELMKDLALTNTAQSLFSTSLTTGSLESIRLHMPALFKSVIFRTILPSGLERMPTFGNFRFRKAMRSLDDAVAAIIAARRAESGDKHGDLLDSLLAAQDDQGNMLPDKQIRDHVMTMLVAGSESTAAVLSWALYEIFRDPDLARRVREEVGALPADQAFTAADVLALTCVNNVISETLRRYPVPFIMRRSLKPVRLGEIELPAGAEIVYSPYLLHHDPRWFPDPLRFDPDRWSSERHGSVPKGAYLPFGAGAHVCIGKRMALAGLATALAVICSHWQLEPVAGQRIREVATGTVHPNRMPMIPRRLPADEWERAA
ncbi:cytochrome P450 [Kibdelosporangium banguiense]|uniref:Cytochrome P450 n=1 Tax=Kibdelosporangium banguiense TaxID=1365924 RepID=A0ABS4TWF5_9PSEU|nr:cytochrome P450 [Kibdelosporangium banguiense]MBP2328295.1 cytochrome P450 [Kibdelosporangium banguiense]